MIGPYNSPWLLKFVYIFLDYITLTALLVTLPPTIKMGNLVKDVPKLPVVLQRGPNVSILRLSITPLFLKAQGTLHQHI